MPDVKRIVLVNLDLIDEYLEAFRDEEFLMKEYMRNDICVK